MITVRANMSERSGLGNQGDKNQNKFKGIDINNIYKGTSVTQQKPAQVRNQQHGLQVLGKVASIRRMPPPANLPSLKSEAGGNDPSACLLSSISAEGFLNQNSPLFLEEFPHLVAGSEEKTATSNKEEESKGSPYGPGPSLRPQNMASWRDVGCTGAALSSFQLQQPSLQSLSGLSSTTESNDAPEPAKAPANIMIQGSLRPPMSETHPLLSPPTASHRQVPLMAHPYRTMITPPFAFRPGFSPHFPQNFMHPGMQRPPFMNSDFRFHGIPSQMVQPSVRLEMGDDLIHVRHPVVKECDLEQFDRLELSDGGWARLSVDMDYSERLVFSDEEDNMMNVRSDRSRLVRSTSEGKKELKKANEKGQILVENHPQPVNSKDRDRETLDDLQSYARDHLTKQAGDVRNSLPPWTLPPNEGWIVSSVSTYVRSPQHEEKVWSTDGISLEKHNAPMLYHPLPDIAQVPDIAQRPAFLPPKMNNGQRGSVDGDDDEMWRQRRKQQSEDMAAAIERARQRRLEEERRMKEEQMAATKEKLRQLDEKLAKKEGKGQLDSTCENGENGESSFAQESCEKSCRIDSKSASTLIPSTRKISIRLPPRFKKSPLYHSAEEPGSLSEKNADVQTRPELTSSCSSLDQSQRLLWSSPHQGTLSINLLSQKQPASLLGCQPLPQHLMHGAPRLAAMGFWPYDPRWGLFMMSPRLPYDPAIDENHRTSYPPPISAQQNLPASCSYTSLKRSHSNISNSSVNLNERNTDSPNAALKSALVLETQKSESLKLNPELDLKKELKEPESVNPGKEGNLIRNESTESSQLIAKDDFKGTRMDPNSLISSENKNGEVPKAEISGDRHQNKKFKDGSKRSYIRRREDCHDMDRIHTGQAGREFVRGGRGKAYGLGRSLAGNNRQNAHSYFNQSYKGPCDVNAEQYDAGGSDRKLKQDPFDGGKQLSTDGHWSQNLNKSTAKEVLLHNDKSRDQHSARYSQEKQVSYSNQKKSEIIDAAKSKPLKQYDGKGAAVIEDASKDMVKLDPTSKSLSSKDSGVMSKKELSFTEDHRSNHDHGRKGEDGGASSGNNEHNGGGGGGGSSNSCDNQLQSCRGRLGLKLEKPQLRSTVEGSRMGCTSSSKPKESSRYDRNGPTPPRFANIDGRCGSSYGYGDRKHQGGKGHGRMNHQGCRNYKKQSNKKTFSSEYNEEWETASEGSDNLSCMVLPKKDSICEILSTGEKLELKRSFSNERRGPRLHSNQSDPLSSSPDKTRDNSTAAVKNSDAENGSNLESGSADSEDIVDLSNALKNNRSNGTVHAIYRLDQVIYNDPQLIQRAVSRESTGSRYQMNRYTADFAERLAS